MATDTKTRQRLYRERRAQEGLQQITVHLPRRLVKCIDNEARVAESSRDQTISKLVTAGLKPIQRTTPTSGVAPAVDTSWMLDLVEILGALEVAWQASKNKTLRNTIRKIYARADRVSKTIPTDRVEIRKALSYQLGRLEGLEGLLSS